MFYCHLNNCKSSTLHQIPWYLIYQKVQLTSITCIKQITRVMFNLLCSCIIEYVSWFDRHGICHESNMILVSIYGSFYVKWRAPYKFKEYVPFNKIFHIKNFVSSYNLKISTIQKNCIYILITSLWTGIERKLHFGYT